MLPTATASSATEEATSIEMQPEPIHDISNKSDEVATDKDEEITSQSSSEPKEAPVPSDKVRLNLLLVSGRKLIIDTDKDDTITQVKTLVLKQWPTEWNINAPTTVEEMNIIYLGKFLANETTLEVFTVCFIIIPANNIRTGRVTTVHLNIHIATNWKDDEAKKQADSAQCKCCIIL